MSIILFLKRFVSPKVGNMSTSQLFQRTKKPHWFVVSDGYDIFHLIYLDKSGLFLKSTSTEFSSSGFIISICTEFLRLRILGATACQFSILSFSFWNSKSKFNLRVFSVAMNQVGGGAYTVRSLLLPLKLGKWTLKCEKLSQNSPFFWWKTDFGIQRIVSIILIQQVRIYIRYSDDFKSDFSASLFCAIQKCFH